MSEDTQTELQETEAAQDQPTAPPAEALKTETPAEHMIPKSRFDEINKQLKTLKQAQTKAEAERQAAETAALEEQNEYKELYEKTLTAQQEAEAKAAALELARLKETAAKTAGLPGELAARLQGATLEELEADAKALAAAIPKKQAPSLDGNAGKNSKGQPNAPTWAQIQEQAATYGVKPDLLAEQYGVTPPVRQ